MMRQLRIIRASTPQQLEKRINEFIQSKAIQEIKNINYIKEGNSFLSFILVENTGVK